MMVVIYIIKLYNCTVFKKLKIFFKWKFSVGEKLVTPRTGPKYKNYIAHFLIKGLLNVSLVVLILIVVIVINIIKLYKFTVLKTKIISCTICTDSFNPRCGYMVCLNYSFDATGFISDLKLVQDSTQNYMVGYMTQTFFIMNKTL